ncbi:atpase (plasmid) [Candidatus Burkholderia crenata]|nr:atpase [Candidatus Burkholderia crenata]
MSTPNAGVHGTLQLLTEIDPVSEMIRRAVRLEAAPDGRSVLLIDTDSRKPGIHREIRYEITPAELIAAIRARGTELRADLCEEQHAGVAGHG